MKAPVKRIIVFTPAGRTHGEDAHRGLIAIIGDILNNREARPAVGAVDKRVVVAPVIRIEKFVQAIVTERGIG